MKTKKLLSLLLAVALLLTSTALLTACGDPPAEPPASNPPAEQPQPPAESETVGDFTYHLLPDDTYAVFAAVGGFENGLTLPSSYKDKPVTQLGYADPQQAGVYYGFSAIDELFAVTVPASVKVIAPYAFANCTNLASVQFAEGSQLTTVGERAFTGCISLSALSLPAGTASVGSYALANCSLLRSVTIPASVTTLGARLLEGCRKLLYISNFSTAPLSDLPQNLGLEVRTSSVTAFTSAVTTTEKGVELLNHNGKAYLFGYVGNDAALDLSALSFSSVYPSALAGRPITSLKLPATLTEIGEDAFRGCAALESLSFAEDAQLTSIGDSAFEGCFSLSSLTLPEGLAEIGYHAFNACESLGTLALPASVTVIGSSAFAYCTSLSTVTIAAESRLATIATQSFFGCGALSALTYNGTTAAWQAIAKNENWNAETGEYTVTCTDGTVAKDGTVTPN